MGSVATTAEFGPGVRCDPGGHGWLAAFGAVARRLRRPFGRRRDSLAERPEARSAERPDAADPANVEQPPEAPAHAGAAQWEASQRSDAAQHEASERTRAAHNWAVRQPDTQVVTASGDLRDTRLLQSFHRRCEEAVSPRRRRVAVDLGRVTDANTKLIATLVLLRRWAQAQGVLLDLNVPDCVHDWMTLCQVEWLLRAGARGSATG